MGPGLKIWGFVGPGLKTGVLCPGLKTGEVVGPGLKTGVSWVIEHQHTEAKWDRFHPRSNLIIYANLFLKSHPF